LFDSSRRIHRYRRNKKQIHRSNVRAFWNKHFPFFWWGHHFLKKHAGGREAVQCCACNWVDGLVEWLPKRKEVGFFFSKKGMSANCSLNSFLVSVHHLVGSVSFSCLGYCLTGSHKYVTHKFMILWSRLAGRLCSGLK
jgi:hypothetical protein